MEAYCREVRKVEDKFRGLELNYFARRYNEANDEPPKIASTRGTVPPDAFLRDLLEPSIDLGTRASVKAPTPEPIDTIEPLLAAAEVMEVE